MVLKQIRTSKLSCAMIVAGALMMSCSLIPKIPVITDEPIERMVSEEAGRILAAADPRAEFSHYRFQLSSFPRRDLLGLSIGHGRIYISYQLAQLALKKSYYRWLLRQTLAHEIAHELAGHANHRGALANSPSSQAGVTARHLGLNGLVRFQNYSVEKELQADFYAMNYWATLGWDCAIWVDILRGFQSQNYAGDVFHPTDRRLEQASLSCPASRSLPTLPPA
jgi:predicted Zn-dependent protease